MNALQKDAVEPTTGPPWAVRAGEVLGGSYKVKRRIAVGGMGEVYLCKHTRLPGSYVAKVLTKELDGSSENFARFRREAEIVAGLQHPNVVQVFDFNVTPAGSPYLVMEYLNGEDLSAFLHARKSFTPHRTAHIVKQVASALQAAHDVGIVHRDLKPENIVLISAPGQEDFVKVIDFGISISASTSRVTAHEVLMGTPHFMSPEQAQGVREFDGRSDQFSLATLAYLMLVGDLPFDAQTPVAVLYSVVHSEPRPFPPHLTAPVVQVLTRALSKDPQLRFDRVIEFAEALETAITESMAPSPVASSNDVSAVGPIARMGIRHAYPTTQTVYTGSRAWTNIGMATFGVALGAVLGAFLMSRFDVQWETAGQRTLGWISELMHRVATGLSK